MSRIPFIFIFLFLFTIQGVSATIFLQNGSEVTGEKPVDTILADPNLSGTGYTIEVYYNAHCGACHVALQYLNNYSTTHPEVQIQYYDLFNSSANQTKFEELKEKYHRPYVSVPVVFIGNAGLEGEPAIRENFEALIAWYKEHGTPAWIDDYTRTGEVGYNTAYLSFPLILFAGLLDGINPCACSVIIALLVCLICIRPRMRAFLSGLVFAAGIFFIYFLAGTGLLSGIQQSGTVRALALFIGLLALLLGIILLHDGIRNRQTIKMPSNGEKFQGYVERLTLPGVMLLALLLGLLELPCSTGIYVSALSMISLRTGIGIFSLAVYDLAFIVPLLILSGIMYWWLPDTEGEQRSRRIIAGLLLLAFTFLIFSIGIRF